MFIGSVILDKMMKGNYIRVRAQMMKIINKCSGACKNVKASDIKDMIRLEEESNIQAKMFTEGVQESLDSKKDALCWNRK